MMHTMQALEKTSWCFLCPVCMHRINVGKSQSPRWGKQAGAEGEGGKNMHHSAHQTPGSAFLNPRLALACCPSASPPTHPPSACNPRPWVQAVRDSSPHSLPQMFSQSIHFLDPISRFKKKKASPQTPDGMCVSLLRMCQQFLAGWPDTNAWQCLRCVSLHVSALAHI